MFEQVHGGTRLTVWVVPAAIRPSIVGPHGDTLKVRVAAPAEAGKANDAMLRLLSGETGAVCTLLTGASGRRKTIFVEGLTPKECAEALGIPGE